MATYAKLPLMAQDYPLGYQTVNQAADNIEAVRAAFAAEHLLGFGGGIPTLPPPPGGAYSTGHHNVATIVRSLVTCTPLTVAPGVIGLQANKSYPRWTPYVTRYGVGTVFISVAGLVGFYGVPMVRDNGTNPNLIQTVSRATTNSQAGGVLCTTFSLSAGAFVLTDFPFSIFVYGWA